MPGFKCTTTVSFVVFVVMTMLTFVGLGMNSAHSWRGRVDRSRGVSSGLCFSSRHIVCFDVPIVLSSFDYGWCVREYVA